MSSNAYNNQNGSYGRGSKDRRTPRRIEVRADRRRRGAELASWLQDRLGLVQKQNAMDHAARERREFLRGNGVTLRMRQAAR